MLLRHPEHPERAVRLAYCQNLHPTEDFEGLLEGLRTISVPLAERLGVGELKEGFGIGLWLPGDLALRLNTDSGSADLKRLSEFLASERLDAFTFNAFPYGGFHEAGLKERVFRPSWAAPERLAFTLAVSAVALALRDNAECGATDLTRAHVSISTHSGMLASWLKTGPDDLDETHVERAECEENMAICALHFAQVEDESDLRLILSVEPEPRSLAGDTSVLPELFERLMLRAREVVGRNIDSLQEVSEAIIQRHVGTCLDACHTAVEFEPVEAALANATSAGASLGKLQFSSALCLDDPAHNHAAREQLFAMDEPVYLHQVTGRHPGGLLRALDLGELKSTWDQGPEPWAACDQWRCHFHVPVDLAELPPAETEAPDAASSPQSALATTRDHADQALLHTLAHPESWGTDELHVEIETYTWNLLPGNARGSGDLVDGLEREYRHVLSLLASAGWIVEKL